MEDNVTTENTLNTKANKGKADNGKADKTRKAAALGLAALGIAGLALGSAAQLNMGTGSLGAGTTVVAACHEGAPIGVDFDSEFADGEYKAKSLDLTGIDAKCTGLDYKVTLTDGTGSVLGSEVTGKVSGSSLNIPLTGVSAEAIENIAVTIHS